MRISDWSSDVCSSDLLVESVEDPLPHLEHRCHVWCVLEEHGELVAAEAGGGVTGAQARAQPVGHHAQELVASTVAEAVVHELGSEERRVGTEWVSTCRSRW